MLDVKILKLKAIISNKDARKWFAWRAMQKVKNAGKIIKIKKENIIIIE